MQTHWLGSKPAAWLENKILVRSSIHFNQTKGGSHDSIFAFSDAICAGFGCREKFLHLHGLESSAGGWGLCLPLWRTRSGPVNADLFKQINLIYKCCKYGNNRRRRSIKGVLWTCEFDPSPTRYALAKHTHQMRTRINFPEQFPLQCGSAWIHIPQQIVKGI